MPPNDLGPAAAWLTATGAVLSVLLTLSRTRGVARLRDNLRRDHDLLESMQPGPARDALAAAVEHQAASLRDRVIHGRPLGLQQVAILNAGILAASGFAMVLLASVERADPDTSGFTLPGWFTTVLDIAGTAIFVVSLLVMVYATVTAGSRWIDAKARRAREVEARRAIGATS